MKTLDQMAGLKVVAGDALIHFGLLCGTIFLPVDRVCNSKDFNVIVRLLLINHAVNAFRFIVGVVLTQVRALYPGYQFTADFTERIYAFGCCLLSIWTIIVAQDFFFFTDYEDTCSKDQVGLIIDWLFLEIVTFYLTFISSALFILISSGFLKKSGISFREKKDHRVDFLTKYQTYASLYQDHFMMFAMCGTASI